MDCNEHVATLAKNVKINHENRIERTFQLTRLFLTVSGIWPVITKYSSKRMKYLSNLVITVCFLMIGFTFVPCALHTIFRERNAAMRILFLGPVGASFGAVLKYAIILLRSETINKCVEQIKNDWRSVESAEELAIMTRHANTGRGIAIICTLFLYTGGMSFHAIVPILKGTKINEFNQTIRPLGYPGYDIFVDPQTTPTYEIIFFLICLSAHVRYTVTIGIISLAAVFVTHACGQVQIVMLRLAKLFDGIDHRSERDELRQRISRIIKGHVNGLR